MRWLLAAMLAIAAGAAMAQAPKPIKTQYETSWSPPDRHDAEAVAWFSGGMRFSGGFHIWFLLGEPVINCTARWDNTGDGIVTVRTDGRSRLEEPREGEIEVYNLLLAASWPDPRDRSYGVGSSKTIVVFCDAGIVAQNGRDGFNVAGSPSWDRFLCALPNAHVQLKHADNDACKATGGRWLEASVAKEVAKMGLVIANRGGRALGPDERSHDDVDVVVLKGEVSGMAVMKRVEKRLWRERSAAFKHSRAQAYFASFPQRPGEDTASWSARKTEAIRKLGMATLPSEDPSAEQLKAYEAAWQATLAENAFDATLDREFLAREKSLVGEQLDLMRHADKHAAAADASIARYRRALEHQVEELKRRGLYAAIGLRPMRDQATDLWGYRVEGSEDWVIPPRFHAADAFNDEGLAEVVLKDEFLRTETHQSTYTWCGETRTKTETTDFRLRETATINFKGEFVIGPASKEYIPDNFSSFLTLSVSCPR